MVAQGIRNNGQIRRQRENLPFWNPFLNKFEITFPEVPNDLYVQKLALWEVWVGGVSKLSLLAYLSTREAADGNDHYLLVRKNLLS